MIYQDPQTSPWDHIKQALKLQLPAQEYSTWLAPLSTVRGNGANISVMLPNILFYQKLHDAYLPLIERIKTDLGLETYFIQFELDGRTEPESTDLDEVGAAQLVSQTPMHANEVDHPNLLANLNPGSAFSKSLTNESHLNTAYTFDTFVKGSSNQFAITTCQAVAMKPGQFYNPLFICGNTGLGKTHLLHAVGNEVLRSNPNAVVTYITSERFMNEMVYCLRFQKMLEFRQKYRMCDVLLIDDIQFMSRKKATQEEFFHTFNTLYAAKKQIVMTSDILPQGIPEIEDRLRNRFQWGLIADIQIPDLEHRVAILYKKAYQLGIKIEPEIAEYIAKHTKRNVRELEGHLSRLLAYSQFQGEPITHDLAQRTFKDIFFSEAPKKLSIEEIQRIVAEHFKVKVADLKSKKKHTAVAHPRQIAMFLARRLTTASLPELGQKFGGKDHTTVLHNVKKIESAIVDDMDLRAVVDTLQRQLEQLN